MLDLDAIEREWVRKYEPASGPVAALVAELRAARQQLEEYEYLRSRLVSRFNLGSALRPGLVAERLIAAYDKVVG